ncbi:MAG TPA: crosslink repair DNA glycosylase YcaQ family protein [Anaerolineales bacterium]|nr:crosslink repair DNA glycosylase YcaQ family protein [Anaerolineales bacterium]
MYRLSPKRLLDYRAQTFRLSPNARLRSQEQAIEYVNQRGFIYFWPIKEVVLPSLWTAVAGDRPVADAHDDPGHVTWGWKDSLLGARVWYYAKILRKRSTLISLEVAPLFYALSENYGSPDEDYLTIYQQGRMSMETRLVYEALLDKGPMDTVSLRRATRLTSRESNSRFERALAELQADFKILPVAVTQAGAWRYAFAYEAVHRYYPELVEQARFIPETRARRELVQLYLRSVGAAQTSDLVRLFRWGQEQVRRACDELIQAGTLYAGVELMDQPSAESHKTFNRPGEWLALPELVEAKRP